MRISQVDPHMTKSDHFSQHVSGRLLCSRQRPASYKPRSGSRGKTTVFALGISKIPMTKDSVEPQARIQKEATGVACPVAPPKGGRQQREHVRPAPTPKRLSNGSEAKHAPWMTQVEQAPWHGHCKSDAVRHLTFLSNAARLGVADTCKAP